MGELVVCNGKQYEVGKFYYTVGDIVEFISFDADRVGYFKFLCRGSEGNLWASSLSEVDISVLGTIETPKRVLEIGKLYEFSDDKDFIGSIFGVLNQIDPNDDFMTYLCTGSGWHKYCRVIQMEVGE